MEVRVFAQNDQGSIVVITAIALTTILAFVGLCINIDRGYRLQAKMAQASDAAAASGAITYAYTQNVEDAKAIARKYYMANVSSEYADISLDAFHVDTATNLVSVDARNVIDVYFSDKDTMGVSTHAAAKGVIPTQYTLEVALALDVTLSMANNNKMQGMKEAATLLVETILNGSRHSSIALVPFNATARFSSNPVYNSWLNSSHIQRMNNDGSQWSGCVINNLPPNDINDATPQEASLIPYYPDLGVNDVKASRTPLSLAHYENSNKNPLLHFVQERLSVTPAPAPAPANPAPPKQDNTENTASAPKSEPAKAPSSTPSTTPASSTPPATTTTSPTTTTASPTPITGSTSTYSSSTSSTFSSTLGSRSTMNYTDTIDARMDEMNARLNDKMASINNRYADLTSLKSSVYSDYFPDEYKTTPPEYSSTGDTWVEPNPANDPQVLTSTYQGSTAGGNDTFEILGNPPPVVPVYRDSYPASNGCDLPIMVPLSKDQKGLLAMIESYSDKGYGKAELGLAGTIPSVGMLWGWRMLSPKWNNVWPDALDDAPKTDTKKTIKGLVLLTDGLPEMPGLLNSTVGYGAYGYPNGAPDGVAEYSWEKYGIQTNSFFGADEALDKKMKDVCSNINAEGEIIVHAVGFDIANQQKAKKLLQSCASDADTMHLVNDNDSLKKAFQKIADSLVSESKVRITE